MKICDMVVFATSADADASALALARMVAADHKAHLAVSGLGLLPPPLYDAGGFGVTGGYPDVFGRVHKDLEAALDALSVSLSRVDPTTEFRRYEVFPNDLQDVAAVNARHADLVVIRAPGKPGQPHVDLIEGALLGGGRPVLVAPVALKHNAIGRNAVLAWDGSREVARAAHDACLLMQPGSRLTIVTVDSAHRRALGEGPGRDVAAHLARHDLKVEVRNVESGRTGVAAAIGDVVEALNADLLIMGGYRHSRVQQTLFGGVTRTVLASVRTPLLLSH